MILVTPQGFSIFYKWVILHCAVLLYEAKACSIMQRRPGGAAASFALLSLTSCPRVDVTSIVCDSATRCRECWSRCWRIFSGW